MKPWIVLLFTAAVLSIHTLSQGQLIDGDIVEVIDTSLDIVPAKFGRYICEQTDGTAGTLVRSYTIGWDASDQSHQPTINRWQFVHATKGNGEEFWLWRERNNGWFRFSGRSIFQQGDSIPKEFVDIGNFRPVPFLYPPVFGARFPWPFDLDDSHPPDKFARRTDFLGHTYRFDAELDPTMAVVPPEARIIRLRSDRLVGVASNMRQKDETRRYDESEYEYKRLTREDYHEMAEAGMNCFKVDAEQRAWIEDLDVFYWGVGGKDVPYPECLYDRRYLGPSIFVDEPAVHTRDHVLRPRLAKDQAFRKAITPQIAFDAFREYLGDPFLQNASSGFQKGLEGLSEVDLGDVQLPQNNLFVWETMVSTAAYQLSRNPSVPSAIVFEPPGRIGSRRTLPEFDMCYGCWIPTDNPKNFTDIIYGFLRGAARLTGKEWGTSIYGAVDRADGPFMLTRAYDLGATRFFFWDNAQLACVPYHECLALTRTLKMHAENHPGRDLDRLKRAAEVAILLPPGYDLGHVHTGRGNLWGIGELNLERTNAKGIKYRQVMGNFFTEIERCLRLGVGFDLLWDLPDHQPSGYREIIRVREDGKVEVEARGRKSVLDGPRIPARPEGNPPELHVKVSADSGTAPLKLIATATIPDNRPTPVYYTHGADSEGVHHNAMVLWEIFGPGEEDYRYLQPPNLKPRVEKTLDGYEVTTDFTLTRPGSYRLRAATVDLAGRSTVVWTPITLTE